MIMEEIFSGESENMEFKEDIPSNDGRDFYQGFRYNKKGAGVYDTGIDFEWYKP